jgi:hypothetical protein
VAGHDGTHPPDSEEARLLTTLMASIAKVTAAVDALSNLTHSMLMPEYMVLKNNVFVYRVRSPFLVIPCGIGDT